MESNSIHKYANVMSAKINKVIVFVLFVSVQILYIYIYINYWKQYITIVSRHAKTALEIPYSQQNNSNVSVIENIAKSTVYLRSEKNTQT